MSVDVVMSGMANYPPSMARSALHPSAPPAPSQPRSNTAMSSSNAVATNSRVIQPSRPVNGSNHGSNTAAPKVSAEEVIEQQAQRIVTAIDKEPHQAARLALRHRWRTLLFDGTTEDEHAAFLLRAGLKNATPDIQKKILKEDTLYRGVMLEGLSQKPAVINAVMRNVNSEQVKQIPAAVLEKALHDRLVQLPADQLVTWLARASRLGYKPDDLVDNAADLALPNVSPTDPVAAYRTLPLPQQPQAHMLPGPPPGRDQGFDLVNGRYLPPQQAPARAPMQQPGQAPRVVIQQQTAMPRAPAAQSPEGPMSPLLECSRCSLRFPTTSGYNYHMGNLRTKRVCEKNDDSIRAGQVLKHMCTNCGRGFTKRAGQHYHDANRVCLGDAIQPPTSSQAQGSNAASPQAQAPTTASPNAQAPTMTSSQAQGPDAASSPALPTAPRSSAVTNQEAIRSSQTQPAMQQQQVAPNNPSSQPNTSTPMVPRLAQPRQGSNSTPHGPGMADPLAQVRVTPDQLTPARRAELNAALAVAEANYQRQVAEAETLAEPERSSRLTSLKNGVATRKSMIRKAHGVSLRLRDKDKQAVRAALAGGDARPPRNLQPAAGSPAAHAGSSAHAQHRGHQHGVLRPTNQGPPPNYHGQEATPRMNGGREISGSEARVGSSGAPPPRSSASSSSIPTSQASVLTARRASGGVILPPTTAAHQQDVVMISDSEDEGVPRPSQQAHQQQQQQRQDQRVTDSPSNALVQHDKMHHTNAVRGDHAAPAPERDSEMEEILTGAVGVGAARGDDDNQDGYESDESMVDLTQPLPLGVEGRA